MLSKTIEEALNAQIQAENYASHYYLAMASWCDKTGLQGSASFLYAHSIQEKDHMMKLFHYVNDAGGHAKVQALEAPPHQFRDLSEIFQLVLKHEQNVSRSINALITRCLEEKDYSTFNFLQWYVAEQHEEELLFSRVLDMMRVAGLEGRGLFLVDREIGKMSLPAKA